MAATDQEFQPDVTSNKRRVYLSEFNVLLPKTAYLPLVSGLLRAYSERSRKVNMHYEFMPFIFLRENIESIIARYEEPSVAGFSASMWNEQYSLKIAEQIKRHFPQCLIVFGGAHVPHFPEEYFSKYSFVDVTVRGEGEAAFAAILERFIESSDFSGIPLVSWRHPATNECVRNSEEGEFERDLDIFPSPYLEGLYEDIFTEYDDIAFQAIVETDRGCPFPCSYCYWGQGGLSRKYRFHSLGRIERELEWIAHHNIRYAFNAASNFGIHKRDVEIAKMLVDLKQEYGYPEKFRSCYGKNAEESVFTIASMLHEHQMEKGITLSHQSMDSQVLRNVRRKNIKTEIYQKLQNRFNKRGIPVYTELILGLPGETYETWVKGIEILLQSGLKNQLFVYHCQVYPNTEMGDKEYQQKHGITTRNVLLTETHGAIREADSVPEFEDIIVSTNTMPLSDWKEATVFSWLTMVFLSLKLGIFILMYMWNRHGVRYTEFLQYLIERCAAEHYGKIIKEEISAYMEKINSILMGEGHCRILKEFGDLYWDEEEASFLRIIGKRDAFYDELFELVKSFLKEKEIVFSLEELSEVFRYQYIRLPVWDRPKTNSYSFRFNIPEYFEEGMRGNIIPIKRSPQTVEIVSSYDYQNDKIRFAREILLWGRKSDTILNTIEWENE